MRFTDQIIANLPLSIQVKDEDNVMLSVFLTHDVYRCQPAALGEVTILEVTHACISISRVYTMYIKPFHLNQAHTHTYRRECGRSRQLGLPCNTGIQSFSVDVTRNTN